jgi:hypothetical protein
MFDPYHKWLAIPRGQRPPTYYQLLGVARDESDPEVIAEAALRQTSHVRTYQAGPQGERCVALLNEIAQARATLLDPARRQAYDATLGWPPADATAPTSPPASTEGLWGALARDGPGGARGSPCPSPAAAWLLLYLLLLVFGGALAFRLASMPDTPPRRPPTKLEQSTPWRVFVRAN